MFLTRKTRTIIISVVLIGMPLLFLQANLKDPDRTNFFDRLLLRASAPVQSVVASVVTGVESAWRQYVYLVHVSQNNDRLQKELRELRQEVLQLRRESAAMVRFQQLLAYEQHYRLKTVAAKIIGRPSTSFGRVLRLKLDHGDVAVQTGFPVVTAEGVIGRIGKVYGRYADVLLSVDPKSAIDVMVQRNGARGVLRGIDGTNRYHCRVDYLLRKEDVRVGDVMVTSGVAGPFPQGLVVGRITRVSKPAVGLHQEVDVEPVVDPALIEEALVVIADRPS